FALRNLSRYRFALVDECSDWKRKLVAILDQVFPEYSTLFSNIYGVTSKELLSKYPLPEDMLSISSQ
ncbi:IS110 family transposase, partial [Helcococcus bovis]